MRVTTKSAGNSWLLIGREFVAEAELGAKEVWNGAHWRAKRQSNVSAEVETNRHDVSF